jgi:hypothetical protein
VWNSGAVIDVVFLVDEAVGSAYGIAERTRRRLSGITFIRRGLVCAMRYLTSGIELRGVRRFITAAICWVEWFDI